MRSGFSELEKKNVKDEENLENSELFKNRNLTNYLQSEVQETYFQNQRRENERREHVVQK